jgi:hypothetical protein
LTIDDLLTIRRLLDCAIRLTIVTSLHWGIDSMAIDSNAAIE